MDDRYGLMVPRTKTNDDFKPVENCELEKLHSILSFYDFQAMNSVAGNDVVVQCRRPKLRFGDVAIGNCSLETYEKVESVLMSFFIKAVQNVSERMCYIMKYDESWMVDDKLCASLATLLGSKRITNTDSCIFVEKVSNMIDLFAKSCFRYNSFVQFIFPETPLILTPTDHLDIFFSSPSKEKLYELLTETFLANEYKLLEIRTLSNA